MRTYPRFDSYQNPIGLMSYLSIEEIDGKCLALIHIPKAMRSLDEI